MTGSRRSVEGRVWSAAVAASFILAAAAPAAHAVSIALTPFANGIGSVVDIANAGDSRLFAVQQSGHIRVVQSNGTMLGTDFLDLSGLVSGDSEQGLLGLAFHPNYLSNGFFYVNYTDTSGDTVISRYSVSGSPTTSNVANPGSASIILTIPQPFSNHNGGDIAFGPNDGYLYIGMGDGGSACDDGDRAQDPLDLLGKMLRIDVDSGSPYAIPPANPFVGPDGVRDEIWALGTRNPWRFSFDRANGNLYIGDVGQNALEEIDFQPASSGGGENYGWDCYEGNSLASASSGCSTTATCTPASQFTFPVHQYSHGSRCSVTGGYVYRGAQSPSIVGHYFFADYCSGDFYSLTTPDNGTTWNLTSFGVPVGFNPTTFGEGADGEVYVAGQGSNTIYRITAGAPPPGCPPAPAAGCTATTKSGLKLKRPGDPTQSKLIWKWLNGPALSPGDFGDPESSTSYTVCLYAGSSAAGIDLGIAGVSGWTSTATGFKYSEPSAPGDGVFKSLLKADVADKSRLLVKARGVNLDLGAMPLNLAAPLTVQLIRGDAPDCWEAVFPLSAISADDGTQLKAKIP